jgi:hypothetical protein
MRDRAAVRDICRRAAYRNRGLPANSREGEFFADCHSRYYTDYEPESLFVAERDGAVIGYLFGCVDTARFGRIMVSKIFPKILPRRCLQLAGNALRGDRRSRLALEWLLLKSWREAPRLPIDRYPAHYHCNLLPEGWGEGLFSGLSMMFLDRIERLGIGFLHMQVLESKTKGPWMRMLDRYRRLHPDLHFFCSERSSSIGRYLLGADEELVNRAYGYRTDEYREWLKWAATVYKM